MKLITPRRIGDGVSIRNRGKHAGVRRWGRGSLLQAQGDRTYAFDINNMVSDGTIPYSASGFAQAFGNQGILDLGGNQGQVVTLPAINVVGTYTPQQQRIDAVMMIEVTQISSVTGLFKLMVVGSNSPSFTAAAVLGMIELGLGTAMDGYSAAGPAFSSTPLCSTGPAGNVYEVLFTNEQQAGATAATSFPTKFEFVSIYNVISGSSSPTITYKAFMCVLPEP